MGNGALIYDPELIDLALKLRDEERAACSFCKQYEGKFSPSHDKIRAFETRDHGRALIPGGCDSYGRSFNPELRALEGGTHCTCDSCF